MRPRLPNPSWSKEESESATSNGACASWPSASSSSATVSVLIFGWWKVSRL